MIRCCCIVLLLCLSSAVGWNGAHAQHNRILPVEDWTYDYITRLQRRGFLLELNPTALPYRRGDVWAALEGIDEQALNRTEQHWVTLLRREFKPVTTRDHDVVVGVAVDAATRIINSDRIDVLRPLGDTLHFYWWGTWPNVYADTGPFVGHLSLRQDSYYDKDPDGLDTALRLFLRSENTYAGYHSRLFSAYVGRFSHHWSVPGEAATLVSNNPRSQDLVSFRLGGQTVSVTALLAELDSITEDGRFTGRAEDDSVRVDSRRRFLAAHRWDIRPSRHFMVSFMESALYSGPNSGPSLKYLNPLHPFIFVVDNTPKNDENNGFVAGLVWAQFRRFTLHGQLMIDDIDSRKESDETLTFAFVGSLLYAAPSVDLGLTLEVVTARAYNAPQPEGKYLYLLRGLATHFNDYVHASLFADVYLDHVLPGLRVTPRLHWLAQGARDIRQPFRPEDDATLGNLLTGTVARTVRPAVQVAYQRNPWWWIRLDGGVNFTTNPDNEEGPDQTRFVGLLEVGLRVPLDFAYRLSFR